MKTLKYQLFLIGVAIFISGCSGSAYYEEIQGGYHLSAIDVKHDMIIGYQDGEYGIGVINATVFAIGQNGRFIIAKQHPKNFPDKPDKGIINYYIIPLESRIAKSVDKNYYGPLSLSEFRVKAENLNIGAITFNRVFKDLE
jgi:hypothetical protein